MADVSKIKLPSGITYNIKDTVSGYTTNTGTITKVQTTAGAHTTINVSSGAATFNVPTKTSHLTNDSGFITNAGVTSVNGNTGAVTVTEGLTPLIGSVDDIAPQQVMTAIGEGRDVCITAPTTFNGLVVQLRFASFNRATDATYSGQAIDAIVSQSIVLYGSVYYLFELIGGISNGGQMPWTVLQTQLATQGDIPESTSDLLNDSDFVSDANYVHTDNNYTSTEKSKLAGIASGAEVNVQSDWNETNSSADDFIKNKPSIPSKTSDLTNDSDFVTSTELEEAIDSIPSGGASFPLEGKNVVVFGDSLIGMYRGDTSATAHLATVTGATVYNVGFGGCRMSTHPTHGYAEFSMWALADAVATDTWTSQDQYVSQGSDYFPEQLATLKSIDFSEVDYVVIHYGTNDFGGGVAIGVSSAATDHSTLCGAARYSIEKLLTAYPKLRIFISLPVYRYWESGGTITYAETYTNSQNNKLYECVAALKSVAQEYNLPVIDGYYGLGINKVNASTFLLDGTHHNTVGRKRFGEFIGSKIIEDGEVNGGGYLTLVDLPIYNGTVE